MIPMDQRERDELLIRIDERVRNIELQLEKETKIIHGNGHEGLTTRIQRIEDILKVQHKHFGATLATIAFLINALISLYAIFHT